MASFDKLYQGNSFNIGAICTRLQCDAGLENRIAMRWISQKMEEKDFKFIDLEHNSNRVANILASLKFNAGNILFTLLPKIPEHFFVILGALKHRVVVAPLFVNFGEDALLDRLGDAKPLGIVTKSSLLKKILKIRGNIPSLKFIILVDAPEHGANGILSFENLMAEASDRYTELATDPETPSVLHYTSGSTGKPKGVLHAHRAILQHHLTGQEVLKFEQDDLFWCTADQGWVTGTSYGIFAPWSSGISQIHFGGGYQGDNWLRILSENKVTSWYTAPTALRMLMREDPALFEHIHLPELRKIFSVGEPLNPEIVHWVRRTFGKEVFDTWFQTETGAIMISNRPGLQVKPGSMGKPVSNISAEILGVGDVVLPPQTEGKLCLKTNWPSMFVTYLNNETAYSKKFSNDFYISGDVAYRDADGYFWFVGRDDDIINTAGHLVSPFEVESALLEIPEIAESGVIGVPDDLLFEKVIAYVCLRDDSNKSEEMEIKIRIYVSNKVSTLATPQEVIFVDKIPKNKSGKIMRRYLKSIYLGQDPGDISTMED